MTLLTTLIAPALALQAAGQVPTAIENDAPETWTLEYPRIIQPFVAEYRRCLTGQTRRVRGEADFEIQHRADLTQCQEVADASQAAALAALGSSAGFADYTAQDVREIFEHIGRIHIARGADLDQQFTMTLRQMERTRDDYEENKPRGLVLELRDASVVKARTDATAEAAIRAREDAIAAQEEARSAGN